ncbi:hypothetical protein Tsubulata_038295 [Turnera subulata]|uniref:Uncharacterized protein n=1 Tax=Turnera subulata TaxID=218843 RepID=A0A9Q0F884_9ROSI|nr:hypothetical protein Tsubulata_038295 [Turnera subulata]
MASGGAAGGGGGGKVSFKVTLTSDPKLPFKVDLSSPSLAYGVGINPQPSAAQLFRLLVVSTIGVPCLLALGWAPFAAWITGWFNVIGQWAFTTSIDFSLAQLIKEIILLSIGGKKGGGYDAISMYRGYYSYML